MDPRITRGLPEEQYDLILEVLDEPHTLVGPDVEKLGRIVAKLPGFAPGRGRWAIESAAAFGRRIDAYSFPEKLHLLDAAEVRHPLPPPVRKRRG